MWKAKFKIIIKVIHYYYSYMRHHSSYYNTFNLTENTHASYKSCIQVIFMQWVFLELNNSFDASISGMIIIILWPFKCLQGLCKLWGSAPCSYSTDDSSGNLVWISYFKFCSLVAIKMQTLPDKNIFHQIVTIFWSTIVIGLLLNIWYVTQHEKIELMCT